MVDVARSIDCGLDQLGSDVFLQHGLAPVGVEEANFDTALGTVAEFDVRHSLQPLCGFVKNLLAGVAWAVLRHAILIFDRRELGGAINLKHAQLAGRHVIQERVSEKLELVSIVCGGLNLLL